MRPIRRLDELSIARIAAGEVVERPASVVKELVENAIDAGARRIAVRIDGGGLRRIEVTDDGHGIPADEVELAFARHATSKIASAGDVEGVASLGFRGEALASIAAVSHVTLTTRVATAELGVRLRIDNGRIVGREPAACAVGTRIVVENLFNAVPARLKFQKSEATEAGRVGEWLVRLAFAHPDVAISLRRGERETFASAGGGDRAAVVAAVLGDDTADGLLAVDLELDGVRVGGLAGAPHVQRANRAGIALFVGGRWIQSPRLVHAVVEAYHALIPAGRFPVAWLTIEVEPAAVDVNVHPAKTEVRFRHDDAVWRAVQRAVRAAVTGLAPVAPAPAAFVPSRFGGRAGAAAARPGAPWPWAAGDGVEGPDAGIGPSPFGPEPAGRIAEPGAARASWARGGEAAVGTGLPGGAPSDPPGVEVAGASRRASALPPLRYAGQVAATFVLAEGPDGLYVIDQHAAHERVVYERFVARLAEGSPPAQALLAPVTVRLTPDQRALVADGGAALARVGVRATPGDDDAVVVTALPEVLAGGDPAATVRAVLDAALDDRAYVDEGIEARLVRAVCKRATVKAGQVLSEAEARALLRDLEACETPHTCPHGRPTVLVWSHARLAQLFGRR